MSIPTDDEVYLDASFLVAFLVSHHKDSVGAGTLFANLLVSGNILNFSPLSIDEMLNGIVKEYRDKLRKGGKLPDLPHAHFYDQLKKAVEFLLNSPQLNLCQFENQPKRGCLLAVENIKSYTLKPRDAFHTAYMQDLGINYVVSNDSNFDRLKKIGLKRIKY